MGFVSLKNIRKIYSENIEAVKNFNLEVEKNEFIVLVGPSGCGKTTTLRMIAGLEEISSGELKIDGEFMNDVSPKDRNIAMVFQNYALYPHMTIYDNMAFGLKLRKLNKIEIDKKVNEAATILGITPLLHRKPKQLSGGQRQRVALGRAIVRDPKIFLMDEPLSNLDAKLRVQMRTEISKLHKRLQATFIYVTHDQTEAMTMGTRIVIMKDGIVQQIDSPENTYNYPTNKFVASFIGSPEINILEGTLIERNNFIGVLVKDTKEELFFKLDKERYKKIKEKGYLNKKIYIGIRPENIKDFNDHDLTEDMTIFEQKIEFTEMMGSEIYLHFTKQGKDNLSRVDASTGIKIGDNVKLRVKGRRIHLFDLETELTI